MATYRREAEYRRYAGLRSDAYAAATEALLRDIPTPFRLASIESQALLRWRTDWAPRYRALRDVGEWNWEELTRDYLRRPSSFHLAIWSGQRLCGLAVGKPSDSHHRLSVDYLEGAPDDVHTLKGRVIEMAISAATMYARALNARTIRLSNPAPALIALYRTAGFELVFLGREVRYCDRRIDA